MNTTASFVLSFLSEEIFKNRQIIMILRIDSVKIKKKIGSTNFKTNNAISLFFHT